MGETDEGPSWFFSRDLEYLDAAQDWGVNPDEWDSLSDNAKGLIIARHRVRGTMRAYEAFRSNK